MKIKSFIFCTLFSLFIENSHAQKALMGTISNIQTELPIRGLDVWAVGVDRSVTDNEGFYRLNLQNCAHCEANGKVYIRVFNPDYGYHKIEVVLTDDNVLVKDLRILQKPTQLRFVGIIKDRITGEPIPGAYIKPMSLIEGASPKVTDPFGEFNFEFDQTKVGALNTIKILIKDTSKRCRFKDNVEVYANVPKEIFLDCEPQEEPITLDQAAKEMLRYGHGTGKYLRSELKQQGTGYIDVKIWYEPNDFAKILEGHENWSFIRFYLHNATSNTVRPRIIQEERGTTVKWKENDFNSEIVYRFIEGNIR